MKNTMPVDDFKKLFGSKNNRRKYHNVPTRRVVGDRVISFDSQKEAARYDELMLMLKSGAIHDLRLQPQFTLQEAYTTAEGERIRAIRYQADFSYLTRVEGSPVWPDGYQESILTVEDVKGMRTKEYLLKKKLMRERHGITIKEI